MNYKTVWHIGAQEVGRNSQVFFNYEEAWDSAKARCNDWTITTDFGVEQTTDPVNYVRKNNTDYQLS